MIAFDETQLWLTSSRATRAAGPGRCPCISTPSSPSTTPTPTRIRTPARSCLTRCVLPLPHPLTPILHSRPHLHPLLLPAGASSFILSPPVFSPSLTSTPARPAATASSWRYGLGERLATRHPHALHHRRRHQPFSKRPLSSRQIEFLSFPSVVAAVRGRKHRYIYGSPGAKAQGVSLPNRACSRWTPRPRRARTSGCCSRTTSAGSPSSSGATAGLLRTTATC